MAAARKQDKTLWRTMRAGNAKKMYSWNTVRKLKMDDDTHTPEESCKMYIKHDLSENPDGFFNHAHVHANALRELFTSSGFSKKVMLQQLCAFFATIRNDDDEAIRIIEPSDKMLGPPILMIAVEEMAVADGSMFKFLIEEKLFVLRELTMHGADWHQYDTSAVGDQNTPIVHAEQYYYDLYKTLDLEKLAGPLAGAPCPLADAPLFNSFDLQNLFVGIMFFHGLMQCELQHQSECDITEQGGHSSSQ